MPKCRIRSEYTPNNFALLRRWALRVLHQEKTFQRSLRQKMKQGAMNNNYMMTVLNAFCQDSFRSACPATPYSLLPNLT